MGEEWGEGMHLGRAWSLAEAGGSCTVERGFSVSYKFAEFWTIGYKSWQDTAEGSDSFADWGEH